jgi:hypothetical protein
MHYCVHQPVYLSEIAIVILFEQSLQGVINSKIGEQSKAAPTKTYVHETLCPDSTAVRDIRSERAYDWCIGSDGNAEYRSFVGFFPETNGERHIVSHREQSHKS